MATKLPIRVGFVGLSKEPFPQGWSNATHLPYLKANPDKYKIVAVLNSTLGSSQAAIEKYELTETAKAFGDLEEFINYEEIDLVTCCVEVAPHYQVMEAALEAGKNVFCEWPLTKNSEQARRLVALAEKKNVKAYTCMETPLLPVTLKLKEFISSGCIGSVIGTNFYGLIPPTGPAWSEHAHFYVDVNSGQSPLHCRVAHPIEAFCRALGEFESFQSTVSTHQKTIRLYDVPVAELADIAKDPEAKPYRIAERTSPDIVLLQGKLEGGVVANMHFHTGMNGVDSSGHNLRWMISGTDGDIEVTQTQGHFLRDFSVKIKLLKGGEVEEVELDWQEKGEFAMFGDFVTLATPGRHYKAIADGIRHGVVDFKHGLKRLEMLEIIAKGGSMSKAVVGHEETKNRALINGTGQHSRDLSNGTIKQNGIADSPDKKSNGAVTYGTAANLDGKEEKKKRRRSSIWKIIGLRD